MPHLREGAVGVGEDSPGNKAGDGVMPARTATLPALILAGGMAFLAGATDAYGFVELRGLYVSFMSGNTTMLGMAVGGGNLTRSGAIAVLIGMFVVGAATGEALFNVAGRLRTTAVVFVVSIVLCIPLAFPGWTALALVLAMGALNAAMSKVGSAGVSLTYVTGALVKFGQGDRQVGDGPARRPVVAAAGSNVGQPACWLDRGRDLAAIWHGKALASARSGISACH